MEASNGVGEAEEALREAEKKLDDAKDAYDESECNEAYVEYTGAKMKVEDVDRQWGAAYEGWVHAKDRCYAAWDNWETIKTNQN